MDRDTMQLTLFPDIVMEIILRYLKVNDLLSCRLASKFCNKAASSVLRKRKTLIKGIINEDDLKKLKECMEQSLDFPFAGLQLSHRPWIFGSDCALKFFHDYGDIFTYLCLRTEWARSIQYLAPFINRLPRVSCLQVIMSEPSAWNETQDPDDVDLTEEDKILKLSSVRSIRILSGDKFNEEVLLEILKAASPSVRIECWTVNPEIVRVLRNAGRFRAVSFMKFVEEYDKNREKWRTRMDQLLSAELPSLTILMFHGRGSLSLDKLEQILLSSQHTLKELYMDGLRHSEFPWGTFRVLAKLNFLSLSHADDSLFRGRHGQNFPALKELHLRSFHYNKNENGGLGYSSGLFVVPSVTRLDLEGFVNEDGMEQLAQSFPNVMDIRLDYGFYDRDPFKIWSVGAFQCLEKLRIWHFVIRQKSEDHINIDSFLTGIPVGICETLRKGGRASLINSPPNEVFRNNPSILNLEHLKELVVCVTPGRPLEKLPEDPPLVFVSMVSVWYALEMMPNLRVKFLYKLHSGRYSEEEKSLLEAAFKNVQPFIKLE